MGTADFIAAMYAFEEIRVEPTSSQRDGVRLQVNSPSLARVRPGRWAAGERRAGVYG
jgi:hypothetical protein